MRSVFAWLRMFIVFWLVGYVIMRAVEFFSAGNWAMGLTVIAAVLAMPALFISIEREDIE